MALTISIFRPDRMVMGVSRGSLTVPDMQAFYEEIVAAGALHYRKIIDITSATTEMRKKDVAEFAAWLRARFPDRPDGAIAIVADQRGDELGLLFAELISGKQPARVFHSIHEARKWLRDTVTIDLNSVRG